MLIRSIFHNKQFRYLGAFYFHGVIQNFAISIFHIFSTLYIFQLLSNSGLNYHRSLSITVLILAITFLIQLLATPFVLWIISNKGLRFCMFWGNIFLNLFFITSFLGKYEIFLLFFAAVISGIYIALYWTAYQIYFVELTDDKRQGEEISIGLILYSIATIGGPAFGGLLISYGGFGLVFLTITVLGFLAILPLKYLPKEDDKIAVNYYRAFQSLRPRTEIRRLVSITSLAVIESSHIFIWPLFIFPLLNGYTGLGFVGSLFVLVTAIANLLIGFLIDKIGAKNILLFSGPLDSLTWIFKFFINSPWQIFTISPIRSFTQSAQINSVDALVYERARHSDKVATIFQREIALSGGRVIFLIILAFLFWIELPISIAFLLTAIFALLPKLHPKTV